MEHKDMARREFVKIASAAVAGVAAASALPAAAAPPVAPEPFWGYLIHLGYNMWSDRDYKDALEYVVAQPKLRFDDSLWNDLLKKMKDEGVNLLVIDLGEGVQYESHPELAVEGSWTRDRLKEELGKVREHGMEPIPKLNFSTCHDTWMGPYARCVSTDTYYKVCADLIAETIALFDSPRYFHLGMDEETAENQVDYAYSLVRQHELWWNDFLFLVDNVTKGGARPWIWSDYVWRHPEMFYEKMPKSVLQGNWYYGETFEDNIDAVKAYVDLEAHGYNQAPTGSNWSTPACFENTVAFCAEHIARERLKGFLQTVWKPTVEARRERHFQAIEQVGRARAAFK